MRCISSIPEKSLDVAVVIPSYDEGVDIIDTLYSAAIQNNVDSISYAIFVVINNPKEANLEVRDSNQLTFQLIDCLQGNSNTVQCYQDDIEKIHKIIASEISIILVDLFSEEHAPEECNVGVARDIGVRTAIPFLKSLDAPVIMVDADCLVSPLHIARVKNLFHKRKDIVGVSGHVWTESFGERGLEYLANRLFNMWRYHWDVKKAIEKHHFQYFHPPRKIDKNNFDMWGANMIFRAKDYEEVGGILPIPTYEDTTFSYNLLHAGKKVIYDTSLRVVTLPRCSERTANGMGHIVKNLSNPEDDEDIEVLSLSAQKFISVAVEFAHIAENVYPEEHAWKQYMFQCLQGESSKITLEDVCKLWEAYTKGKDIRDIAKNDFYNREVYEIAKRIFKSMRYKNALESLDNYKRTYSESFKRQIKDYVLKMYGVFSRFIRSLSL